MLFKRSVQALRRVWQPRLTILTIGISWEDELSLAAGDVCLFTIYGGSQKPTVTLLFLLYHPACPFSPPTAGPGWLLPLGWEAGPQQRQSSKAAWNKGPSSRSGSSIGWQCILHQIWADPPGTHFPYRCLLSHCTVGRKLPAYS